MGRARAQQVPVGTRSRSRSRSRFVDEVSPDGLLVLTEGEYVPESGWRYSSMTSPTAVRGLRYPQGSMIVIAGVPAIGKTTLIERAIPEGVVVLCPDLIRSELQAQAGVEDFDESFWGATFDLLHERVDAELASEHTVVVHVTGLNRHQQQDLTRLTRANDREAHIIFLDATRELCAAGLSGRVVKIPNARMEKYHEQWDDLKSRLLTRSEDVLEGEILDLNDGRSRRKFALLGSGESMMRARGFNSVTIINREAVNNLQRIHFV